MPVSWSNFSELELRFFFIEFDLLRATLGLNYAGALHELCSGFNRLSRSRIAMHNMLLFDASLLAALVQPSEGHIEDVLVKRAWFCFRFVKNVG